MKKIINKIYRFLVKLLCAFIPSKKLRRKIRDVAYKNRAPKLLIKRLKKLYPNSVFLWLPVGGIGEFAQIVSLIKAFKEKINKNIVLITNKKVEKDVVSLIDESIVKCYYEDGLFYDISKIRDNITYLPKNLNSNTLYPAYKYADINFTKRDSVIGFLKDFYNLDQDVELYRINPIRPENNNQDFLDVENIFKNKKVVFIFPEANTYDYTIITKEAWIDVATKLTKEGYICIFNSKEKYGDFVNIFFDIKETLYLAGLAFSIISFRSGIAELLAMSTNCNMIAVYPNAKTHLFTKNFTEKFLKKTIKEFEEQLERNDTLYILNKDYSPIIAIFIADSISKNFNKNNCENYIYDFDNEDFYNFIISKL